jgi:hypothetical protein
VTSASHLCCFCSDCGTLGNLVAKLPAPAPEDDERVLKILMLLRDVAEGLKALHEAGVVHGDLVSGLLCFVCFVCRHYYCCFRSQRQYVCY